MPQQPFYFLVVLWGETHRRFFLDLALSSLLSTENIPVLQNPGRKNKFLIATTIDDWAAMNDEPIFELLKKYMEPEWINIPNPAQVHNKMLVMSSGHKKLTDRAFADRAYGIHICPDVVYSDGSVKAIQAHANSGKTVVLTAAVRFELEGVMDELQSGEYLSDGPLEICGRDAVAIGLRHPHGEFQSATWNSPFFWDFPVYTVWPVPGEHGVIQHSYSWSPILLNYAALDEHFTEIFENWTLDGDYVYKNFQHLDDDLYVVTDSDEMFLLPVTAVDEASPPLTPHWSKTMPVIGDWTRGYLLNMVHNHTVMDPLKRRIYFRAVRWHSKPLNEAWAPVEKRVMRFLIQNVQSTEASEELASQFGGLGSGRANISETSNRRVKLNAFVRGICINNIVPINRRLPVLMGLAVDYTKVILLALIGGRIERERIRLRVSQIISRFKMGA